MDHMLLKQPRRLLRFEVQVVEHCNLRCVNCNHFAPLASEQYLDVAGYERDCRRLSELFCSEVEFIHLMGGEPLLHPQINEIMKITRSCFQYGHICLVTNGLLLSKMTQEFWDICKTHHIEIDVTDYPIPLDQELYKKKASENQVSLSYYGGEDKNKMLRLPIDVKGDFDPVENFHKCPWANYWVTLRGDGKIYTCTKAACAEHLKNYFDLDIALSEQNAVDIYKVHDAEELMRKLAQPIPFCRYCDLEAWNSYQDNWRPSNKDRYEWLTFTYSEEDIRYLKTASKIYIFDSRNFGREVIQKLMAKGVSVEAVLVLVSEKSNDYGDIPVIELDCLEQPGKDDVCLLVMNGWEAVDVQDMLCWKGFQRIIPLFRECEGIISAMQTNVSLNEIQKKMITDFYDRLGDEESKNIYKNRWQYVKNHDRVSFIRKMVNAYSDWRLVDFASYYERRRQDNPGKKIVIYGAGKVGQINKCLLEKCGYEVAYMVDKNYEELNTLIFSKEQMIYAPERISEDVNKAIVIISIADAWEEKNILRYLRELHGVHSEDIYCAPSGGVLLAVRGKQYFDLPYMTQEEKEVFVDGGCYDGETSKCFQDWAGKHFKASIGFECDTRSIDLIKKNMKELMEDGQFRLVEAGCYSDQERLHFVESSLPTGSYINDAGSVSVPVDSIDHVLNGERVSFIKLDVQGVELEALKGAEQTIKEHHPKLAISLYHKDADMYEIPLWLMEIAPDYTFYIRHYDADECETILYAV